MCSDRTDARNLQQILSQHPQTLGAVLERAQRLAEINQTLCDWCDEPWVRQLRIANVRGDTVVLYAASAAALIPLRQHRRSLLTWLRTRYRLTCSRIDAKVRPPVCTDQVGSVSARTRAAQAK
ncbi:hypothetical protein SAMN04488120_11224 [Fontimonas thermophila]|uniref:DUF721 domain-containing protein n=1 Tax=Fontimonas thermophila TaxID=1076937 RepID=A0A1I2K6X0_9GAMM|nr:hypothetical protein [Fontimonas thermophila]SFF60947.1 hypothetical protein SAMN04488120_11224 [Fontimonas thermophila]